VPEWDGQQWQPTDMSGRYPDITWPENFDPNTLPKPKYTLGQVVQFYWANNEVWKGEVRSITMSGGYHDNLTTEEAIHERYSEPIRYIIHSHGHGRWIKESNILY